jgi:nucleoid DNA-binding protein
MAIKKIAVKKTVTKKAAAPVKAAKVPAANKPIKETLNKTGLLAHIAEQSGVELKSVRQVIAALESAITGSVSKKGAGAFVLPGFLKITSIKVPAKPKRKGLNRFTGQEQWFAAKPASLKIRVRPLKKLKDAAAA